ncbi:hypothetical protein BGZ63DRAFT_213991 [Mariannaea sp. PMI_226]|nr:hypothetical protein BGZ63DRAFT_213991 [Mariannaea sp. PMI_226]
MREPCSDGGRGDSSSEIFSQHHYLSTHSISSIPTCDSSDTPESDDRTSAAACANSPISPPTSPYPSPCLDSQSTQNQPLDLLAFRFRNQLLIPRKRITTPNPSDAAAVAPAASLFPHSPVVPSPLRLEQDSSTPMELDSKDMTAHISICVETELCRNDPDIVAPTPISGSSRAKKNPSSPPPTLPLVLEAEKTQPLENSLSGLQCQSMHGEIEVDEGYCEEDDDFLWMDSIFPHSDPSNAGAFRKRIGLEYRTSSEAASRCKNAVHSVPRMRRRDKKKRHRRQQCDKASDQQQ